MPTIPSKLHFIWVGKPIPIRFADNIIIWAEQNPQYEVALWTQHHLVEESVARLVRAFQNRFAQTFPISLLAQRLQHGLRVTIREKNDAERAEELLTISVNEINTLSPLIDPTLLAEEMYEWKNYGAASDILRFWVIYEMGGIYMDVDTYTTGQKIPCNISAPLGFLIYIHESYGAPSMLNCIMASTKGLEKVKEMATQQAGSYRNEYAQVAPGVLKFSEAADVRLETVKSARSVLADPAASLDDKADAERDFTKNFVIPTTRRMRYAFNFSSDELEDISFTFQSGFEPIIKSEGTWRSESMKPVKTILDLARRR